MRYEKGSFITVPSREKLRGIHPTAQTLYMWLCAYSNETGTAFPSRATLAKDCGVSTRTIDVMAELLVGIGLIERNPRYKNNEQLTNLYTVLVKEGVANPAIPLAESAIPPSQNLRTELNPILTQSKEITADAVYIIEEETPRKTQKKDSLPYEKYLRWAEKRRGSKFIHRVKQYAALKKAKAIGVTDFQLGERWIELESKPFYEENGLDWTSVVSSFDKKI